METKDYERYQISDHESKKKKRKGNILWIYLACDFALNGKCGFPLVVQPHRFRRHFLPRVPEEGNEARDQSSAENEGLCLIGPDKTSLDAQISELKKRL